jgi:PqqD family protein of HPr-rel-A system
MTENEATRLHLRVDDVSWRDVGDEAVVLESTTGTYLTLNPTGKLLWRALEQGATEAEMAAMLVEQYGIDEEQAAGDVTAFVDRLRARRLVEADRS